MQTKTSKKTNELTARDFTYVYEPGIGRTFQNGPYLIGVGRTTYACNYLGQCFSWGLESFNEAIRACAKHDAARRAPKEITPNMIVAAYRPDLYRKYILGAQEGK